MQFDRLIINNFASYYGEHSIDLRVKKDKPVIIILGGTGFGKTSLFDAINWSLYGTDYELELYDRRERRIVDYVNETALAEAIQNKTYIDMSCTLHFEHLGSKYYITQSLSMNPSNEDSKKYSPERHTELTRILPDGNHKKIEYNAIFLNEILPSNVKSFFLFDGDRIYNLANPARSQEVREAIKRVVNLELIENAKIHLGRVSNEFRKEAKNQSAGELKVVEEKYEECNNRIEKLKADLSNSKQEEETVKKQLKIIDDKLMNLPDTSRLQTRIEDTKTSISETIQTKEQAILDLREFASTSSLIFSKAELDKLIDELESKRKKGEIPKTVSQTLLKDIISMGKCLCGTEFKVGDPEYKALLERLDKEKSKSPKQDLINLQMELAQVSTKIEEHCDQLNRKYSEYLSLEKKEEELNLFLKQLQEELESLPQEDIVKLTSEARERRDALAEYIRKIQDTHGKIEHAQEELQIYSKEIDNLSRKNKEAKKLHLRERLALQAAEELERIYENFSEDCRKEVEKLTKEEFKHFVESAFAYDVQLTKDYELQVLDSSGGRALQRLSMGQSQCLSLSFITAIARVSEKNPPLVIDMPFSRLDLKVHDSVSTRLPRLSNQLILFLIPGIEWNDITSKNLKNKSSHIYNLDFDKNKKQSVINTY